jgi:hypothetical protein
MPNPQRIIFTSIAANYLSKARVLARSVKMFHPQIHFAVCVVDGKPGSNPDPDVFDEWLTLSDLKLPVENLDAWIFQHGVVELCTAIKGAAFQYFFQRRQRKRIEQVFYLDPDIFVLDSLSPVFKALESTSVLLTPHLTRPEASHRLIAFNECGSLKNGVFNLGFLGVRNTRSGRAFADWWSERLLNFCRIDPSRGLFTDQKWIDLVPVFFPDHRILRDPGLNVARWNVSQRRISRRRGRYLVEGRPLRFFHFSSIENGIHGWMTREFGGPNPDLEALTRRYQAALFMAEADIGQYQAASLENYTNGEPITPEQRHLYRSRQDLIKAFPKPRQVSCEEPCFLHWYKENLRVSLRKQLDAMGRVPSNGILKDLGAFLDVVR